MGSAANETGGSVSAGSTAAADKTGTAGDTGTAGNADASGSTVSDEGTGANNVDAATSDATLAEFDKLVSNEKNPGKIRTFIDENISKANQDAATKMVLKLEETQQAYLSGLESRFADDGMQAKLRKIYKEDFNKTKTEEIIKTDIDSGVKELLTETLAGGYRVETAEGMYFPIMDYSIYTAYSPRITDDIAAYHALMAVESAEIPAKDNGLVIGWDEVTKRALNQERFLVKYPDSKRKDAVEKLYKKYLSFTFFGANNTPLFEYETNTMNSDAKEAYIKAVLENTYSSPSLNGYIKKLNDFMKLCSKNGYKLTDEVTKFRKDMAM